MYNRGSSKRGCSPKIPTVESSPSLKFPSSTSRYSFRRKNNGGFFASSYGTSPTSKIAGRHTSSSETLGYPGREGSYNEDANESNWDPSDQFSKSDISNGAKYSLNIGKEVASIDKINSPESRSLIIAGKSHLGIYRFNEDTHTITKCHDFLRSSKSATPSVSITGSSTLRRPVKKISAIADVKAGFHNHKNYFAVCGTSSTVSIYDINKTSALDNPIVTTLSEHTRSINSVDFNMVQTNLIISGGQDGCIKVWDLRSSKMTLNRSDVSINTGSDSIRDVKWMPSYDFSTDSNGLSNRQFKFASCHDSGLLLKFDLRQPSQAEKKINAHSGPALCLNWHPHQNFIVSGGRDGKCCLWDIGDTANQIGGVNNSTSASTTPHNYVPSYPLGLGTTTLAFPELTIKTARPMSKLKFRPKFESNIFNSLIGTSSMGEDSDVSIFSLARKYIPRNVLSSDGPSVGFVWWDENIIFNIDKQNVVTGWDLSQQPTVLDNLPKAAVKWRDLDGNGILFLDQRRGGYSCQTTMTLTPGSAENRGSPHTHRMSSATGSSSTAGKGSNSASGAVNSAASISKHGSPFGTKHSHTGTIMNERPSFTKNNPSFTSKCSPSLNNSPWSTPYSLANGNSSVSASDLGATNGNGPLLQSPYLIGLDLPNVLNTIRNTRLLKLNKTNSNPQLSELKSSPTETFKFLARELKFSSSESGESQRDADHASETSSINGSIKSNTELMDKLGLAESNTWTNLVRNTKSHDSEDAASKSTDPNSPVTDTDTALEQTVRTNSAETEKNGKAHQDTSQKQGNVNKLIELITACDKNAETYMIIEDLSNYKVWLLIRDALIWDLKLLTESLSNEESSTIVQDETIFVDKPWTKNDSLADLKEGRQNSIRSDYSSYIATDLSSSANTNIGNSFNEPIHLTETPPPTSQLKTQIEEFHKEPYAHTRSNSFRDSPKQNIQEFRELNQSRTHSVESVLEEDDEEEERNENEGIEEGLRDEVKNSIKIPTRKSETDSHQTKVSPEFESSSVTENSVAHHQSRRPRTSFIDSFISHLRSPGSTNLDGEQGSVGSRLSSMPSFGTSGATFLNKKNMTSSKTKDSTVNSAIPRSDLDVSRSIINDGTVHAAHISGITTMLNETKMSKDKVVPPWSSKPLVHQLYEQSVASGNILLTMSLLLLFHGTVDLVDTETMKNSIAEFTTLLHRYELFEIAAELMKNCPFEDISNTSAGLSTVQLFCDECGNPLVNEASKEKFSREKLAGSSNAMSNFGHWYCDSCSKKNTLCCYCNKPMKNLTVSMLSCGHEGHMECMKKWFIEENMDSCPLGCSGTVI